MHFYSFMILCRHYEITPDSLLISAQNNERMTDSLLISRENFIEILQKRERISPDNEARLSKMRIDFAENVAP